MMLNKKYSSSVDWFSFGILLFEMLCGKNPLKDENQLPAEQHMVVTRINEILASEDEILTKYEETKKFSPEAYDLLEKLLRFDPEMRIGCRDQGTIEIK